MEEKSLISDGRPDGCRQPSAVFHRKPAQGNARVWGTLARVSLPGATSSWGGGTLAKHPHPSQPTGTDSLQSPALSQPCCKPEQNPVLCLAWHGRLSSPGVVDAQISSGFSVLSSLGEKMDGPKLPYRSFPSENPVPPMCPCAVCVPRSRAT